ncbi:hypothetical protein H5200_02520 [Pseudoalteromonas sp. SG43-7]|uniref:hypothetical protein n=1 Tax=Pseudoalteromonas sp. SG43-7 TaxID=2760966 RepID=UPI001603257F|nr:hypothetical protein [Pseudoalteromonas sp. SG43-7]MBB1420792.1 hypothetical protein [Pseudoalteromonas sp. SG43-7]
MNERQRNSCHAIIHTHATIAGAGNLMPVPGAGIAVDITTMTSMCMSLSSLFKGDISEEVAKGLAIAAIKETILKQPIKVLVKEVSKVIPLLGQLISPAISVAIIEAAGWSIANTLYERAKNHTP